MIVQCEGCKTRFRIADDKVTARGVRVRCTKCKETFVVRRDESAAAEAPAETAPSAGPADASPTSSAEAASPDPAANPAPGDESSSLASALGLDLDGLLGEDFDLDLPPPEPEPEEKAGEAGPAPDGPSGSETADDARWTVEFTNPAVTALDSASDGAGTPAPSPAPPAGADDPGEDGGDDLFGDLDLGDDAGAEDPPAPAGPSAADLLGGESGGPTLPPPTEEDVDAALAAFDLAFDSGGVEGAPDSAEPDPAGGDPAASEPAPGLLGGDPGVGEADPGPLGEASAAPAAGPDVGPDGPPPGSDPAPPADPAPSPPEAGPADAPGASDPDPFPEWGAPATADAAAAAAAAGDAAGEEAGIAWGDPDPPAPAEEAAGGWSLEADAVSEAFGPASDPPPDDPPGGPAAAGDLDDANADGVSGVLPQGLYVPEPTGDPGAPAATEGNLAVDTAEDDPFAALDLGAGGNLDPAFEGDLAGPDPEAPSPPGPPPAPPPEPRAEGTPLARMGRGSADDGAAAKADAPAPKRSISITSLIGNGVFAAAALAVALGAFVTLRTSGPLDASILSPERIQQAFSGRSGQGVHVVDVISGVYRTREGDAILYVRGEVENPGETTAERLGVSARVVDRSGAVQASATGVVGAVPTAEEVWRLDGPSSIAELRARLLADGAAGLGAGERAPFFAVFDALPEDLFAVRFEVEVVDFAAVADARPVPADERPPVSEEAPADEAAP